MAEPLRKCKSFAQGKFADSYKLGRKIGQGHFGVVREVTEKASGRAFACKVILKSAAGPDSHSSHVRLQRETELGLEVAGLPGIVRTVEAFEDEQRVYLVMELLKGGTLADYIDRRREGWVRETEAARESSAPPGEMEAMRTARRERIEVEAGWVVGELAAALAHCHEMGIVHRDMKPENVLLSREPLEGEWVSGLRSSTRETSSPSTKNRETAKLKAFRLPSFLFWRGSRQEKPLEKPAATEKRLMKAVTMSGAHGARIGPSTSDTNLAALDQPIELKIADFGLAERLASGETSKGGFVGSPAYVAPEVVQGHEVGFPADVWGLGVILYFLLSDGRLPFTGRSTAVLLRTIGKAHIDLQSPALVAASADAKSFLQGLLAAEPGKRLSAAEVVAHPWVQQQMKKRQDLRAQ